MHTFLIVGGSALGAAAGAIGTHYYFNRDMKKGEALTLGSRHFVNYISSLGIAGLTKGALGDGVKNDAATMAVFLMSLIFFAEATKASASNDIETTHKSWRYKATVGGASLLTAMAVGFAVVCSLSKR